MDSRQLRFPAEISCSSCRGFLPAVMCPACSARRGLKLTASSATSGFFVTVSVSTKVPSSAVQIDSAGGLGRETLRACAEDVEKWENRGGSPDFVENLLTLDHSGSLFSNCFQKTASLSSPCRQSKKKADCSLNAFSVSLDRANHYRSTDYTKCRGLSSSRNLSLWVTGANSAEWSCWTQIMSKPTWKN